MSIDVRLLSAIPFPPCNSWIMWIGWTSSLGYIFYSSIFSASIVNHYFSMYIWSFLQAVTYSNSSNYYCTFSSRYQLIENLNFFVESKWYKTNRKSRHQNKYAEQASALQEHASGNKWRQYQRQSGVTLDVSYYILLGILEFSSFLFIYSSHLW